jgi:ribosome maturation factor RimP
LRTAHLSTGVRTEELISPVVTGMGYELVDAQASNGGRLLRLFIDKPGGVTYERLEVSSPGLDRPLRKESDFARFAGSRAEVRMRTPDASGRRKFVGVLRGAGQGRLQLEAEGQMVALALDDVERARLVPEL